ncbi:hypothetical protein LshimejAT787_1104820 [Lyophyllum shimeji]|uniref:Uncharacterized protein n=1 Tax=Lyophyllum shimeji TaxID=47721 RepID=A0A9P3PWC1_LYOSH|nr:hypothetical protein LshimejAT787_1104820 [Lyophyllum shimeji]
MARAPQLEASRALATTREILLLPVPLADFDPIFREALAFCPLSESDTICLRGFRDTHDPRVAKSKRYEDIHISVYRAPAALSNGRQPATSALRHTLNPSGTTACLRKTSTTCHV